MRSNECREWLIKYINYRKVTFACAPGVPVKAGDSIIVGPVGKLIAKSDTMHDDDIIETEIPIAEFRKGRTIPAFAMDIAMPVISQYRQPFPLNHLDIPSEDLPQTGEEMKVLLDSVSAYKNK